MFLQWLAIGKGIQDKLFAINLHFWAQPRMSSFRTSFILRDKKWYPHNIFLFLNKRYGYPLEAPRQAPKHMFSWRNKNRYQGPVVQCIVSLTSSLVVKMLIVLVSTISNSHVFLLKKCTDIHTYIYLLKSHLIYNTNMFEIEWHLKWLHYIKWVARILSYERLWKTKLFKTVYTPVQP